ncbi:hypothetical protein NDN08_004835 [Rhodosorus marinus]|uniref:Uncharacterized protein n=1 Tax=Rhodosorus marinus TaxID=101924 RepID=A0AAV8UMF0_9RHOD|nr:hypothetical protein NDN08_004835 [Rhodosorus marinus]
MVCADDGKEIRQAGQYRTYLPGTGPVGKALYLANMTRLDLSFAVRYLAQTVASPTERGWKNLVHLCRYIGTTANAELTYSTTSVPEVVAYSDASFGNERGRTQ